MVDKKELVDVIAKKASVSNEDALFMVNEVIAELVSPSIFAKPGGEAGFINDNNCKNNCKEALAVREQSIQR